MRRRFRRKRGNVGVSDRRDEAIPATVDCLDEAWNPCLIAKRYAKFSHRGCQNRITDRRCRPRRRQQFILRDKAPRLAQQTLKYCKRLMTQADVLFTLPQPLVEYVKTKRVEHEVSRFSHASGSSVPYPTSEILFRTSSELPQDLAARLC